MTKPPLNARTNTEGVPARFGSPGARLIVAAPTAVVIVATLCRGVGFERGPISTVVAFTPWFALLGAVALIAAVLVRAPESIVVLSLCVAFQVMWLAPLFHPAPRIDQPSRQLVVMASNLREGLGSASDVVSLVRARDVDLLALEELSPDAVAHLNREGLDSELAHHVEFSDRDTVSGSGLWSRFPITQAVLLPGHAMNNIRATVTVGAQQVETVVAHPASPGVINHSETDRELTMLREQLEEIAGPVIVGGDFNATRDQVQFRDIERIGYTDAAAQAGAGLLFTWPKGTTWIPGLGEVGGARPVVALDHVLTRDTGLSCTSLAAYAIRGSDHLAIVAVLTA